MNFHSLTVRSIYDSYSVDISKEFHKPLLERTVLYKRATGYFTSKVFLEVFEGIKGLIKNEGYIQILTSPQLSEEDVKSIRKGYASRKEIIERNLLFEVTKDDLTQEEKDSFALLSRLIAYGIVDVRIVHIEDEKKGFGIYHEKNAIAIDKDGNKIAFSGSMNATQAGHIHNYETIDVYSSLKGEHERIEHREKLFDELWENKREGLYIGGLPSKVVKEMEKYPLEKLPEEVYTHPAYIECQSGLEVEKKPKGPLLPESVELREYQKEAIEQWEKDGYRGIFSMATGTGKTFTGLAAAAHLYEQLAQELAIIIVVPYQHLVMQWVDDIKIFNMDPIIGFSTSPQKNWENNLKRAIMFYNLNDRKPNHFCFVTTNATFALERVQKELRMISKDLLIIVDEAHNLGSESLQKKLLPNATYRLGLSATIERHGDEAGTEALLRYFENISFVYTLEQAIRNNMLTRYYYYPVLVHLTEEELEEYRQLSHKIARAIVKDKYGKVKFTESAKMLMIKRARLVAGASNKVKALKDEIEEYKNDSHILVYCGATTVNDVDYEEGSAPSEEIRQIDAVSNLLGNELNMKTTKFTSEENAVERKEILEQFEAGDTLQTLSAIRCLDEGVNIPSIERVFLLASSTNPKEYIQRRGRVLRKFEGKRYAYIHDFITLPVPLEEVYNYSYEELRSMRSLVAKEVTRMKDFAQLAENSSVADGLIEELSDAFLLYELIKDSEEEEELI